jgi:hypothetical protein
MTLKYHRVYFRDLSKAKLARLAARRARWDSLTPEERKRLGFGPRPGGKRP